MLKRPVSGVVTFHVARSRVNDKAVALEETACLERNMLVLSWLL